MLENFRPARLNPQQQQSSPPSSPLMEETRQWWQSRNSPSHLNAVCLKSNPWVNGQHSPDLEMRNSRSRNCPLEGGKRAVIDAPTTHHAPLAPLEGGIRSLFRLTALPSHPGRGVNGISHGPALALIRKVSCRWLILAFSGLCLLSAASPAQAHRVLVYAYADGDILHTESKFVGSGAVQQGQVQILDQKTGRTLLSGTTDDQGKFSCKIPPEIAAQRLDLLIVVEASMGHRGEWPLKAESYLSGAATAAPAATSGTSTARALAPPPPAAAPDAMTAAVDRQVLEETLNKALERQLSPIKAMLAESQRHQPTLTDIIGGIGYIMGIFGLLAYFQSRRKRNL